MKENLKRKPEVVGKIGVDSGLCWIGDPCYIISSTGERRFESWKNFCSELQYLEKDNYPTNVAFPYDDGGIVEGLGVCVSTGYGDGYYPVIAHFNRDGRISKIEINFITNEVNAGKEYVRA